MNLQNNSEADSIMSTRKTNSSEHLKRVFPLPVRIEIEATTHSSQNLWLDFSRKAILYFFSSFFLPFISDEIK